MFLVRKRSRATPASQVAGTPRRNKPGLSTTTSSPGSRTTDHASRTKLDDAHTMLSEVYHWFTEGFDTVDLKEAKALLEELG